MQFLNRKNAFILVMCLLGLLSANLALGKKKEQRSLATQMDQPKMALHALNRLTFVVRPGGLERITTVGLDKWIDQQLHPERITDSAVETRISPYSTLSMATSQIVANL